MNDVVSGLLEKAPHMIDMKALVDADSETPWWATAIGNLSVQHGAIEIIDVLIRRLQLVHRRCHEGGGGRIRLGARHRHYLGEKPPALTSALICCGSDCGVTGPRVAGAVVALLAAIG